MLAYYEENINNLSQGLSINTFGIKDGAIVLKIQGKDCICSHCPKALFLSCVKKWQTGNQIAIESGKPYYYFCPLNLTLAIMPVGYLDSDGGIDYLCVGPRLIKDLDLKKQYVSDALKSLVKNAYIPFNMTAINHKTFKNYVKIAYLSFLGIHKSCEHSKKESYLQRDKDSSAKIYEMENNDNSSVFQLEKKALEQMGCYGDDLQVFYGLFQKIAVVCEEDIKWASLRLAQTHYTFVKKAIELGVHLEFAEEMNKSFLFKLHSLESIDEMKATFIESIESIHSLVSDFKRKENLLVYKTKVYVRQHYKEHLTLSIIADKLNISYNYLSNLFNKEIEISFSDYLQQVRVDEGKELLCGSNLDLIAIAFELGFSSQSYFSKVFKKFVGKTPGEYRRHYQQHIHRDL